MPRLHSSDARHSVDLTYRTPRHNHNAIEPHAVTLAWDGDDLIVHDASQGVKLHAWTFAQVFGIDENQVHLTSPYVGGGFGGKTLWSHHVLGAAASKLAGRPVRVTLSREGVYRLVGGRTNTEQRVAIGADDRRSLHGAHPHRHLRDDCRTTRSPSSSRSRRGTCTRPRP